MAPRTLSKLNRLWQDRFGVVPLEQSIPDLTSWFESPLGQALLQEQRESMQAALQDLFGYHLLQLSMSPRLDLSDSSRISHRFSLNPLAGGGNAKLAALADFTQLPLPEESIDVALLHHVLDFSESPHQLLREASRVLIARGHLVIVGFNPWSLFGSYRWFARFVSRNPRWRHQALRLGRVLDWLKLLDFEIVNVDQGFFRLPSQSPSAIKHLQWLERWGKRLRLPLGGCYIIVACKDRVAVTPLKPAWQNLKVVPGLSITKLQGRVKSPSVKTASQKNSSE